MEIPATAPTRRTVSSRASASASSLVWCVCMIPAPVGSAASVPVLPVPVAISSAVAVPVAPAPVPAAVSALVEVGSGVLSLPFCVPLYPTLRVQILRHEGVCSCAIVLLVVLLQPEPAPVPAPPAAPAVDPTLEAELAAKLAQVKALEGKVADVKNTVLKVPPHTCACDACSVWCSGAGCLAVSCGRCMGAWALS
jgi:hypothetical protein